MFSPISRVISLLLLICWVYKWIDRSTNCGGKSNTLANESSIEPERWQLKAKSSSNFVCQFEKKRNTNLGQIELVGCVDCGPVYHPNKKNQIQNESMTWIEYKFSLPNDTVKPFNRSDTHSHKSTKFMRTRSLFIKMILWSNRTNKTCITFKFQYKIIKIINTNWRNTHTRTHK